MKTTLPNTIRTIEDAKVFLTELHINGEAYHPEDDATALNGDPFTLQEGLALNQLMSEIYDLHGNDGRHSGELVFDPCEFLLMLDPDYVKRLSDDETDDEDDRLFTSSDMHSFALQIAVYANRHPTMSVYKFQEHITNELRYLEGDGSYETYIMPTR